MKIPIPLFVATLGLLTAPMVAFGFDVPRHVHAMSDLSEAQESAEKDNRPLMFVFTQSTLQPS
jgi:hypothetical protein